VRLSVVVPQRERPKNNFNTPRIAGSAKLSASRSTRAWGLHLCFFVVLFFEEDRLQRVSCLCGYLTQDVDCGDLLQHSMHSTQCPL